jgi:hypothetical protein
MASMVTAPEVVRYQIDFELPYSRRLDDLKFWQACRNRKSIGETHASVEMLILELIDLGMRSVTQSDSQWRICPKAVHTMARFLYAGGHLPGRWKRIDAMEYIYGRLLGFLGQSQSDRLRSQLLDEVSNWNSLGLAWMLHAPSCECGGCA